MVATAEQLMDMPQRRPGRPDGRSLRRERNREAVIDALLDIVREGNIDPGGAEIAERAGVSHRSLFRYFDDLGDLVRAAVAAALDDALPLAAIERLGEGTLPERIDVLVDSRLRMYRTVHDVATVARARALTIPEISTALVDVAALLRTIIRQQFAEELSTFPEGDLEFIVDAVQVLVGWDGYDAHRRLLGHGDEWIRRSWITSLTALLTP